MVSESPHNMTGRTRKYCCVERMAQRQNSIHSKNFSKAVGVESVNYNDHVFGGSLARLHDLFTQSIGVGDGVTEVPVLL